MIAILILCLISVSTASNVTDQILRIHNLLRANYQAAPLKWSDSLAVNASKWANRCVFEHSPYQWGENIAMSYDPSANMTYLWYQNEECAYYNDVPGATTGHFTQMVWPSTKYIGCAFSNCTHGIKEPLSKKMWLGATMFVCEYANGGNDGGKINKPLVPPRCPKA